MDRNFKIYSRRSKRKAIYLMYVPSSTVKTRPNLIVDFPRKSC